MKYRPWRSPVKQYFIAAACITLAGISVFAADLNKEQKRLEQSGVVMQEVLNVLDNIPHDLLEKAECVIVFPNLMKAAFIVGAEYGRGAMACRTGEKSAGLGALLPCTRLKAEALVSKSEAKRPI